MSGAISGGVDHGRMTFARVQLWNTETWAWEASTKGSGVGQAVSVENFPAVMSGISVPVNDVDVKGILQSILAKITGLVFVVELGSFVATIGD